jgi:calcium-dependent protein kinase
MFSPDQSSPAPARAPDPERPPRFQSRQELGKGQFGTTYLVSHKVTKREAACKAIAKRKLVSAEDVEDVRREISILHHLGDHPNIVELIDAYEGSKHIYIVMELCEGGELFDRIVARGHYSEKDAATIFRTMMRTVAHCHNLGVIHRDLKPENFVLKTKEPDAAIKAIDFGLSTYFEPQQHFHDIVGSAYYVAPEVLKRNYSNEADVWSAGVILYILLAGVPPFWAQSEQAIFDEVLKGKYDLRSDPWDKISEGAKDVVRKMLVSDPKQRATAQEVLNHPWVREDGDASDEPLEDVVLSRMRKFAEMNKFKKMGMLAVAKTLSKEEIAGMKEVFQAFDTDRSGTVTISELMDGLRKKGVEKAASEVAELVKSMDMDGNGELDYEEFIAATLSTAKMENEDNLARAFAYFDKDNSGYISRSEVQKVITDFGLDHEFGDVNDFMAAADTNKDGKIDYDEFLAVMTASGA